MEWGEHDKLGRSANIFDGTVISRPAEAHTPHAGRTTGSLGPTDPPGWFFSPTSCLSSKLLAKEYICLSGLAVGSCEGNADALLESGIGRRPVGEERIISNVAYGPLLI